MKTKVLILLIVLLLVFVPISTISAQGKTPTVQESARVCNFLERLQTLDRNYTFIVSAATDINRADGYMASYYLIAGQMENVQTALRDTNKFFPPQNRMLLLYHLTYWQSIGDALLWIVETDNAPLPVKEEQYLTLVFDRYAGYIDAMKTEHGCVFHFDQLPILDSVVEFVKEYIVTAPPIELDPIGPDEDDGAA